MVAGIFSHMKYSIPSNSSTSIYKVTSSFLSFIINNGQCWYILKLSGVLILINQKSEKEMDTLLNLKYIDSDSQNIFTLIKYTKAFHWFKHRLTGFSLRASYLSTYYIILKSLIATHSMAVE